MEKAEVIKAFHLMWDNYPESAMLIDKKRNIIAANKVAPSTGRKKLPSIKNLPAVPEQYAS